MKLLSSLDRKDRTILFSILGLAGVLMVLVAFFTPARDPNSNPVPDSYLTGQHGAKAAFTLLEQSGYAIERWEQPLAALAAQAGPGTVLVLAQPRNFQPEDREAVGAILSKGGRVLATGAMGGYLLPQNAVTESKAVSFAACEAQPVGFGPLAGAASIWIVPLVAWSDNRPETQAAYTCAGEPVVVEYPVGKGDAIWWASSTPLENSSITRGGNLELLLDSIGPAEDSGRPAHIYWDESLHGQVSRSLFDYAKGPLWTLLWSDALGLTLLVVFSFSRRSGPVRPLPQAPRTTPIEFIDALGGLYRANHANSTAVQIAWERFRRQSALQTGQRRAGPGAQSSGELSASELASLILRRFGAAGDGMEQDLIAAEQASEDERLKPRRALAIVQALRRHEETLRAASSPSSRTSADPARDTLAS